MPSPAATAPQPDPRAEAPSATPRYVVARLVRNAPLGSLPEGLTARVRRVCAALPEWARAGRTHVGADSLLLLEGKRMPCEGEYLKVRDEGAGLLVAVAS